VADELPVHVNRQDIHSLEVPASFETDGSFDVRLINHGEPLHLHVHLDDALSDVAAIEATNHYVEGESQRSLRVHVHEEALTPDPILGKLKVASGYGAETRWIDIELAETDEDDGAVRVDESLGKPRARDPEPTADPGLRRPEVPVMGLGLVALVVAIAAALVIEDLVVLLGALAVLGGVFVALYFLLQG